MRTFQNLQLKLAGSRSGRISLHLICLCRDRKLRWHMCGMGREIHGAIAALNRSLAGLRGRLHHATGIAAATHTVAAIHDTVMLKRSLETAR